MHTKRHPGTLLFDSSFDVMALSSPGHGRSRVPPSRQNATDEFGHPGIHCPVHRGGGCHWGGPLAAKESRQDVSRMFNECLEV